MTLTSPAAVDLLAELDCLALVEASASRFEMSLASASPLHCIEQLTDRLAGKGLPMRDELGPLGLKVGEALR